MLIDYCSVLMRLLSVQRGRTVLSRMLTRTIFREGIRGLVPIGRMGSIVEGVSLP